MAKLLKVLLQNDFLKSYIHAIMQSRVYYFFDTNIII